MGSLPLQTLIVLHANPRVILSRLQSVPSEATLRLGCLEQSTPLHLAIEEGIDDTVVFAIMSLDKAAVALQNDDGQLPLHLAASHGASEQVVAALLEAYPEAIRQADEDDRLPLHYAAEYGTDIATFLALFRAYPQAAAALDSANQLPLHLAVQHGAEHGVAHAAETEAAVATLLLAHPAGASARDSNGRTALELARMAECPLRSVVAALVVAAEQAEPATAAGAEEEPASGPTVVHAADEEPGSPTREGHNDFDAL